MHMCICPMPSDRMIMMIKELTEDPVRSDLVCPSSFVELKKGTPIISRLVCAFEIWRVLGKGEAEERRREGTTTRTLTEDGSMKRATLSVQCNHDHAIDVNIPNLVAFPLRNMCSIEQNRSFPRVSWAFGI